MGLIFKLIVGLVVLAALAGGGAYLAAQQQPSVAAGLSAVPVSAEAAKSFDAKVERLQAAADEAKRTGRAQAVDVTFDETELTSKAQEALSSATGEGTLVGSNAQIHLVGGNVVATSKISVQGFEVNVGVVAQPIVVDGKMQLVVKQIETGILPLPDAVKQQINARLGSALDFGLPIDVSQLQIKDGKLVIGGTAKP